MPLGKINRKMVQTEIKKSEEAKEGRSGGLVPFYTLTKGKHTMRILPPWAEGVGLPVKDVWKNFKLPPDGKTVTSLKTWGIDEDPILLAIQHIRQNTGTDMGRYIPKYKGYVNAWVRKAVTVEGEDEKQDGLFIVQIPTSVRNWFLCQIDVDPDDPDEMDITDLYEGVDIVIDRQGDGLDTQYICSNAMTKKYMGPIIKTEDGEADEAAIEAVIAKVPNLDNLFPKPDDKTIEEYWALAEKFVAYYQIEPMKGRSAPKSKPTADMEDEDEPDAKPSGKSKAKAKGKPTCYGQYEVISKKSPDKCKMCAFKVACRHQDEDDE